MENNNKLLEMRENLNELRKCIVRLALSYLRIPGSLEQIDCEELLSEIKYLCGYVDCMIKCGVPLCDFSQ